MTVISDLPYTWLNYSPARLLRISRGQPSQTRRGAVTRATGVRIITCPRQAGEEKENHMLFSNKLRLARQARNLTQQSLATLTGISSRTIQNYELGARMPKKMRTYKKLAEVLGIDEEVLKSEEAVLTLSSDSTSAGSPGISSSTDSQYSSHDGTGSLRNPEIIQTMITDIAAMWSSGEINEEDMDAAMQKIQEAYWEGKRKRRG